MRDPSSRKWPFGFFINHRTCTDDSNSFSTIDVIRSKSGYRGGSCCLYDGGVDDTDYFEIRVSRDNYVELYKDGTMYQRTPRPLQPRDFPLSFSSSVSDVHDIVGVAVGGNSVERFDSDSMVHSDLDAVGVHVTGSWLPADCVR